MEMYEVGNVIHDLNGSEWRITNVWDYKNFLCMHLIGMSGQAAGQVGGLRIPYEEEGGAAVITRV